MASLVEIVAQLVSSHASSTPMTTNELLAEISKIHSELKKLEAGLSDLVEGEGNTVISPNDAFKKNEVVCLVCGKGGFKTLARHLATAHDLKPRDYKKQFRIPASQSLAAKSYSEGRRKMAKQKGLADNLVKAREVRLAKMQAKKAGAAKGKGRTQAGVKGKTALKAAM